MLPKVTIVTPSYNQAEFLESTIQSVLDQQYGNLEYIVIDGGSTDGSVEIIKRYEQHIAYWVSEPDGGQAAAINKGFAKGTGEYLGWINSDDILYPESIAKTVEFLEAHSEIGMVYGDIDVGNSQDSVRRWPGKPTTLDQMLLTFDVPIPQQGSLWRRSLVERAGYLDPRWHVVLDREFFLRLAGYEAIAYLPETLGFFRTHPACKSVGQSNRWLDELPVMYEEYFAKVSPDSPVYTLRGAGLGIVYARCAIMALKMGYYRRSLNFLAQAFKHDPGILVSKGMRATFGNYFARIIG